MSRMQKLWTFYCQGCGRAILENVPLTGDGTDAAGVAVRNSVIYHAECHPPTGAEKTTGAEKKADSLERIATALERVAATIAEEPAHA